MGKTWRRTHLLNVYSIYWFDRLKVQLVDTTDPGMQSLDSKDVENKDGIFSIISFILDIQCKIPASI